MYPLYFIENSQKLLFKRLKNYSLYLSYYRI